MAQKSKQLPKGYDFGKSGLAMLVASANFVEYLREAEVVACAYGWNRSSALGHVLPFVSLGAIHEEPLKRAFGEFKRWQEESQTDPVDLTFVLLREGGYLLGISSRSESISRRLGHTSLARERLLVGATYIKKFDTRDPWLQKFREYQEQRIIAPFLFGACVVSLTAARVIDQTQLREASGAEDVLMFQAEVGDEDDAESAKGTAAWMVLRVWRRDANSEVQKPPQPGVRDTFSRRSEAINHHFPVTVERVRLLEPYSTIVSDLERQGIRRWQVEQAICNLVLSASLCGGLFHYGTIRTGQMKKRIGQALIDRFEEADSKPPFKQTLTTEVVLRQVDLDARALLELHGGQSRGTGFLTVQQLLKGRGLLDET